MLLIYSPHTEVFDKEGQQFCKTSASDFVKRNNKETWEVFFSEWSLNFTSVWNLKMSEKTEESERTLITADLSSALGLGFFCP